MRGDQKPSSDANFSIEILVKQDLTSYLMHMIEEIAGKLKDPAETKNVSKVRLKLDGYHQAWL